MRAFKNGSCIELTCPICFEVRHPSFRRIVSEEGMDSDLGARWAVLFRTASKGASHLVRTIFHPWVVGQLFL